MARVAWLFCALAVAPAAMAFDESAAPGLDPAVVAAWHEPAAPGGGDAWQAYLKVAPGSNVTSALYQVCRVGKACFNPPTPAAALGNNTFRFASTEVASNGQAVRFGDGWRVGVKWYLQSADGTTVAFPPDPEGNPVCADLAALACQEAHYVAFDLASGAQPSAAVGPLLAVALAALVAARRRHA